MDAPRTRARQRAASKPLRILGVDPGLKITGYAVLESDGGAPRLREGGVVRSTARAPIADRVLELYEGIREVIAVFQPAAMALEQLFSTYQHPRTAILMGHARGVLCLAAAQAGIPVVNYSATRVKKLLTGSGRAPKEQMQRAVAAELHLKKVPDPNDVADACAVALCHFHAMKGRFDQNGATASPSKVAKFPPTE